MQLHLYYFRESQICGMCSCTDTSICAEHGYSGLFESFCSSLNWSVSSVNGNTDLLRDIFSQKRWWTWAKNLDPTQMCVAAKKLCKGTSLDMMRLISNLGADCSCLTLVLVHSPFRSLSCLCIVMMMDSQLKL